VHVEEAGRNMQRPWAGEVGDTNQSLNCWLQVGAGLGD